MRALLDTNIIIHREASRVLRPDIGSLFLWLDNLRCDKVIHPATIGEIRKHANPDVVRTFEAKLGSYQQIQTTAPEKPAITELRLSDRTENDHVDTTLLNELLSGRVDILITEDIGVYEKSRKLGISDRVYSINTFLEKAVADHPKLVDYKVLAVRQELFGQISLDDPFFDSFKRDYQGFEAWFNRKESEVAYVSRENGQVTAFLYVKQEGADENYSNIAPPLSPAKRLKIGTFKVSGNGYRLGERFLKVIFDNAMQYGADEIYVTIFDKTDEQRRLIRLLSFWGFIEHGVKRTSDGEEKVFIRDFRPRANREQPALTYPFVSRQARKFIVPIWPSYHTELLPDSLLRTEEAEDYSDNRPNRNAIGKAYISRSIERGLKQGDLIVFYRTREEGKSGWYTSVATTLGVVQSVVSGITSLDEFIRHCNNRSVFPPEELTKWWNDKPRSRPFVVNFLYIMSFPKRLNLCTLTESNIISIQPRGFEPLSDDAFNRLLELSNANKRYLVD